MLRQTVALLWAVTLSLRYYWRLRIEKSERGRYFTKSVNFALCYMGFSCTTRIVDAFRAGTAAFLCCAYDVITDWRSFSPDSFRVFKAIADERLTPRLASLAFDLYYKEKYGSLRYDGLERGYVALLFVSEIMGSTDRLKDRANLEYLGLLLQIVDDVLDYEEDTACGDTNCLNSPNRESYLRILVNEFTDRRARKVFPGKKILLLVISKARAKAESMLIRQPDGDLKDWRTSQFRIGCNPLISGTLFPPGSEKFP